jgi:hypothetical protein
MNMTEYKIPRPVWARKLSRRIKGSKNFLRDLTARAAAATEPKPRETDKIVRETEAPKADAKEPVPKSETT